MRSKIFYQFAATKFLQASLKRREKPHTHPQHRAQGPKLVQNRITDSKARSHRLQDATVHPCFREYTPQVPTARNQDMKAKTSEKNREVRRGWWGDKRHLILAGFFPTIKSIPSSLGESS